MNICSKCLFMLLCCIPGLSLGAETEGAPTDNIRVRFLDVNGKLAIDPSYVTNPRSVRISVEFALPHIEHIDVLDDAKSPMQCKQPGISPSPSTLASVSVNSTNHIQQLVFDVSLPCSAYRHNLNILVKVKTKYGNYYKRVPVPLRIMTGDEG